MPKNVNWDSSFASSPADSESVRLGAQRIRETRLGVEERLSLEHHFGAGDGDSEGRHKFPFGDLSSRDSLSGVVDGMLFFEELANEVYLQLRAGGTWKDLRAKTADQAVNADKLDGYQASQFLRSDTDDVFTGNNLTITKNLTVGSGDSGNALSAPRIKLNAPNSSWDQRIESAGIIRLVPDTDNTGDGYVEIHHPEGTLAIRFDAANKRIMVDGNEVWHAGNDGAGSGLDADKVDGHDAGTGPNQVLVLDSSGKVPLGNIPDTLTGKSADKLDGLEASQFLRSDADDTFTGTLTWDQPNGVVFKFDSDLDYVKRITVNDGTGNFAIKHNVAGNWTYLRDGSGAAQIRLDADWGDGLIALEVAPQGTAGAGITWSHKLEVKTSGVFYDGVEVAQANFGNCSPTYYNWSLDGATSYAPSVTNGTYLVTVMGTTNDDQGTPYDVSITVEGVSARVHVTNHPDGSAPWSLTVIARVTDGTLNITSSHRMWHVTAIRLGG